MFNNMSFADNERFQIIHAIENCQNIINECKKYNITDEVKQLLTTCNMICGESDGMSYEKLKLLFGLKFWSKYNVMKEIEECIDKNFDINLFQKKFTKHDNYYSQHKKCIYEKNTFVSDFIDEIVEHKLSDYVQRTYYKNPSLFFEILSYKFGFCKNKHFNVNFCLSTEYIQNNDINTYEVLNMRVKWNSIQCTCNKYYQKFDGDSNVKLM